MSTLERAIAIATKAHERQVDKGGAPYIQHLLRVRDRVLTEDEKIVAVLHDVVEDGGLSFRALRADGFSRKVVAAVKALTRHRRENYEHFVRRAAKNDIARKVKLADLFDNCDLTRIPDPTPADCERRDKYRQAIQAVLASYKDPLGAKVGPDPPNLPRMVIDYLNGGLTLGEFINDYYRTVTCEQTASALEQATQLLVASMRFPCSVCSEEAGHLVLFRSAKGVDLLRCSFTSTMGGGGTPLPQDECETLQATISRRDVRAIFDVDRELTPFYCPDCDGSYCGKHWSWWHEFDEDGFDDCIRGRCPKGHERMLED